jgi:AraC-like DNA-binding protein
MAKPPAANQPHPAFIARQVFEYRYFFLNLTPCPRSDLTVACGGWERCTPDYRVERANFAFFGLEYVAKGSGTLTLNGSEHSLVPGSIFAYRPFTAHSIRTDSDDPMVKYFIDFSGRNARGIIGNEVLGIGGAAFLRHVQPIHDTYEDILQTGLRGGKFAPKLCSLLLQLLSLRIEENAHTPGDAQGRARQNFERCRSELHTHFRTIMSVSELARRTHLDPAYVARLFGRFAGESPYQMLTRLKMNEAAAHLIGGRSTVKEVAARVGFADPYHFSRAFKKHHGTSPARFHSSRRWESRRLR